MRYEHEAGQDVDARAFSFSGGTYAQEYDLAPDAAAKASMAEGAGTAAGTCGDVPAPSGTACPTGRCANGTCCSGCINNNICQPGTVMQACGTGGAACTSCITFDPCRPASCVSGSCTSTNLPDNTPCTEGSSSGRCVSGACCHGCRRANGACNATASILNCGSGGQACVDCTASEPECKQSQCIAGGCNYVNKGNGTPCSTGTCQGGVCQ